MAWDDALARTDEACARHFDTVACSAIAMHRLGPNTDFAPDTSRASFGFSASLESSPELSAMADANRPRPSDRNIRQVTKTCLTAVTTGWPWMLRQGDRVQVGPVVYQVAANPDQDGTVRVAIWLNRIAG